MADHLEFGMTEAMKLMLATSTGSELDLGNEDDHYIWMGAGWMVAKGWIAYRGGNCFKFVGNGRKHAMDYLADAVG